MLKNKISHFTKAFLLSVAFLLFFCIALFSQEQTSTVTIEHAEKTVSTKSESDDTSIINFLGSVVISVEKNGEKTTISAQGINYNREKNVLYAYGNVTLKRSKNGKDAEEITAQSVLFNISTQEGVFNDGRVIQKQQAALSLDADSYLFVQSELFGRDSSSAVTFKNGSLSFCNEDNPHWKIKASRIWLLPGDEFSFANAFLYVGVVPVLYLPFFYYPKDEMIFNPSFGYRQREGYFFQTTTYLLGRKPLEKISKDDKDGFNFLKNTKLKEQERQGLFLHNLESDAKMPDNNLKIMADYYSTLGGMIGVEGSFKPKKLFSKTDFSLRFGFNNVVFPGVASDYISLSKSGKIYYETPWALGFEWPFRFALNLKTGLSFKGGSLSLSLPFYTDSYFNSDFGDRSEYMDWISYLMKSAHPASTTTTSSTSTTKSTSISSFTWNLSGSYKPTVDVFKPWISAFSLTSFSSSILFSSKTFSDFSSDELADDLALYSSDRKFFYPSKIVPLSIQFNSAGSFFEYPFSKKTVKPLSQKSESEKLYLPSLKPPLLLRDDDVEETGKEEASQDVKEPLPVVPASALPFIVISSPSSKEEKSSSYRLSWTLKPKINSDMNYSSSKALRSSFDISTPKSSFFSISAPFNLLSDLKVKGEWFSIKNTISFAPLYQEHPFLNKDEYSQSEIDKIKNTDFSERKLTLKNTNTITFKPFAFIDLFKTTSLSWNMSIDAMKSKFVGDIQNPQWEYEWVKWDKDFVKAHTFTLSFGVTFFKITPSLSFKANLPPLLDCYTGTFQTLFPSGKVSLSTGYKKTITNNSVKWKFESLKQSFSYKIINRISVSESYSYNIEDKYHEKFITSIGWNGLSFKYSMQYTYPYSLDPAVGWKKESDKKFLPYSLAVNYTMNIGIIENKSKTIALTPKLSTSLNWDMIRSTNSSFVFKPSIDFKIKDFVTISFSATSHNKVLMRYVQDFVKNNPSYTLPEIPGEKNIFIDLFNSFAFWDTPKREASGFKLKSLAIKLEHDLHDWTIKSEFKVEPRLLKDVTPYRYDFKPFFSFSVVWKPLKSMKTVVEDKYGEFKLNP